MVQNWMGNFTVTWPLTHIYTADWAVNGNLPLAFQIKCSLPPPPTFFFRKHSVFLNTVFLCPWTSPFQNVEFLNSTSPITLSLECWWLSDLGTLPFHVYPSNITPLITGCSCFSDLIVNRLLGTLKPNMTRF